MNFFAEAHLMAQICSSGNRYDATQMKCVPLGDDCIVEAGLYLTAGTKVKLPDGSVVVARELSGQSGLLYRRNSQSGAVEAVTADVTEEGDIVAEDIVAAIDTETGEALIDDIVAVEAARIQKAQAEYIKQVSGNDDPATQIANAKKLHDEGVINDQEFADLKAKALAS